MKKQMLTLSVRTLIFLVLTILTQIGGFTYLVGLLLIRWLQLEKWPWKAMTQLSLYGLATVLLIPSLAPAFGREPIRNTAYIQPTNYWLTVGLNRNYVVPELNAVLDNVAQDLQRNYPELQVRYLDPNFPFFDHFPLVPHLSHHDGRKLDLSFVYKDQSGQLSNHKPTISGYGDYTAPLPREPDTTQTCKQQGYWQYDYTKYLTLGHYHTELVFSEQATKSLLEGILADQTVSKVFIEPHLKQRLQLTDPRVRFHGCWAVRHDDHIHLQI